MRQQRQAREHFRRGNAATILIVAVQANFRGEISAGGDLAFHLRLAFAALTSGEWSYLMRQANSLWNEGPIEAFHDATNLAQA